MPVNELLAFYNRLNEAAKEAGTTTSAVSEAEELEKALTRGL